MCVCDWTDLFKKFVIYLLEALINNVLLLLFPGCCGRYLIVKSHDLILFFFLAFEVGLSFVGWFSAIPCENTRGFPDIDMLLMDPDGKIQIRPGGECMWEGTELVPAILVFADAGTKGWFGWWAPCGKKHINELMGFSWNQALMWTSTGCIPEKPVDST